MFTAVNLLEKERKKKKKEAVCVTVLLQIKRNKSIPCIGSVIQTIILMFNYQQNITMSFMHCV